MKALVLTASELRHRYFAKVIGDHFELCGLIQQPKKKYYKDQVYESSLVQNHFKKLNQTEIEFFSCEVGSALESKTKILEIESPSINEEHYVKWAQDKKPDVVFLFGTRILGDLWLDAFPNIINLHLGLSPYYRGSATLFWPFVHRNIACVGTTIHLAVKAVDAGPILNRVKPKLEIGDDYYSINFKAIRAGIDAMPKTAQDYLSGAIKPLSQSDMQKGYLFSKKDFNETVLAEALNYLGQGLTNEQLNEIAASTSCNC